MYSGDPKIGPPMGLTENGFIFCVGPSSSSNGEQQALLTESMIRCVDDVHYARRKVKWNARGSWKLWTLPSLLFTHFLALLLIHLL